MITITWIIASLVGLACAEPIPRSSMLVLETRSSVPSGFAESGSAAADASISLHIQLAQSNISGLEEELYAVSTPSNARYGQHLTKEQVSAIVLCSTRISELTRCQRLNHTFSPPPRP